MHLFNRVSLRTPESVELEFRLAGIGSRALALFVDYTILAVLLVGLIALTGIFVEQLTRYLEQLNFNYSALADWFTAIAILAAFAIFVGYFVLFETLWQGQTPGKRVAKIRVIRDDGRPVRLGQTSLRALLRPVDDLLSLGVVLIILGDREKRLGDWVAGTLVVQEVAPRVTRPFTPSEQAQAVATQLSELATLSALLPNDFAVIREYLQRRSLLESTVRSQLSLDLARQAKAVIGLESLPQDMSPDLFLEAVYLAYQDYAE